MSSLQINTDLDQHSCTTQLISLLEDLSYSMDHCQQTDVILLDFAKAFDSTSVFHIRETPFEA